jgi:hypothetical protein
MQSGDSRQYCRVPIDDIHNADNIFELLRDAVNFICTIIINFEYFIFFFI